MEDTYECSNVLLDKTLKFAVRIVKLEVYLKNQKNEYAISKQVLRSATSIGANAHEAVYGISRSDFNSKMQISLKETAETEYWIKLLLQSGYINEKEGKSLLDDCIEIKKILISTLNTSKQHND